MSDHDAAEAHHPNVKAYLFVFGTLLVLTVVTVLVSYWHLPPGPAIAVGLLIATVKAGLVAAIFMHLKGEKAVIFAFLGLCGFFLILLFGIPIWDFHDLKGRSLHTPITMDAPGEAAEHEAH